MNIQELIDKNATGKKVLFFFLVAQLIYGTMLLVSIPKVLFYSNGLKILDLLPTGYTPLYVQNLFETLGEEGRAVYLWQQIPLDMLYPGLFAISYSLLLAYILKKLSLGKTLSKLSVLPVFSGLFDYMENAGILTMLMLYPTFKPWMASITSAFSVLKSITTTTVLFLLLGVVGMLVLQRIRRR